jgi:transposase
MSDTELLLKPETVRLVEVFTGTGRRRRWTAEQKAGIVAESHAGGETVCAVARRHGLTPQQLFGWRRAARRRAEEAGGQNGLTFAPVVMGAAQPCFEAPRAPLRPGGSSPALIEIVIGVATVRIAPGADAVKLQTVLRELTAVG